MGISVIQVDFFLIVCNLRRFESYVVLSPGYFMMLRMITLDTYYTSLITTVQILILTSVRKEAFGC